jgi:hypothetical protein
MPEQKKQLRELVSAVRAECGHSMNVAHGLNDLDALKYLIDRVQQDLWEDYTWPRLVADRDIVLVEGTRYYNYPTDMGFDDIEQVWLLFGTVVGRVDYGIGPEDFILWNSQLVPPQMSWPVRKWMHHADDGSFEVWPVPDANVAATDPQGIIRFRGNLQLVPMVNDDDTNTLPWRIIVLTAAAEILAKAEDPAAQTKAQRAAELIRRNKVRENAHKTPPFVVGGSGFGPRMQPRIGLDYIPEGYGSGPSRR